MAIKKVRVQAVITSDLLLSNSETRCLSIFLIECLRWKEIRLITKYPVNWVGKLKLSTELVNVNGQNY